MKTTQHHPYTASVPPLDPLAIAWQLGDKDMIRELGAKRRQSIRERLDGPAVHITIPSRDPALGGWVGIAIMVAVAVFIGVLLATGGVL